MVVDTNIFTGFACVSIDPLAIGIWHIYYNSDVIQNRRA
jgi:hypothetical protein